MFNKLAAIILIMLPLLAGANATRVLTADSITNPAGTAIYTLPGATSTLATTTTTQTLTGKTMVGTSNTFSLLPVSTQMRVTNLYGNGITTAFTITATPTVPGLLCFTDGVALDLTTDYTYTAASTTVTFVVAPATGQMIKCYSSAN